MGVIGSTSGEFSLNLNVLTVNNPIVENVTLTLANTEYSHTLRANTKRFLLKLRGAATLKLSYAVGTSATTFLTIPHGVFYSESNIDVGSLTLYLQTPSAAQLVEIVSWT